MKKTLRLILLAVATIALLTSCDAMLENMFPKETAPFTTGNNTLTVNITGYDYSSAYPGYWGYTGLNFSYYATRTICVDVYDQYGAKVVGTSTSFTNQGAYAGTRHATPVTFTGLKDGTYTFRIWYDMDGDVASTWESAYTNGWYYTEYVYTTAGYQTSLYLPNSGNSSVTVDAYLDEHSPY